MQNISADANVEPFPHIVFHNFYTDEELDLIWEELNFYTRPKKLFDVEDYQGVVGYTKAKALHLDSVYTGCLLYTSPSPRDLSTSRMPSSA